MFTGIIQNLGQIVGVEDHASSRTFSITHDYSQLQLGESIAVNGVCLTVTAFDNSIFKCDVSPETLDVTTANNWCQNYYVNLERAMAIGDRLGGHMVSGHVDNTAEVITCSMQDDFMLLAIGEFNLSNANYLIKKGSITVDGVSLTINEVSTKNSNVIIELMLIPHTQDLTTLGKIKVGDKVNIEFDMIAKIVAQQSFKYMKSESE